MYCNGTQAIAFAEKERGELGLADARGVLQDGLKNRFRDRSATS